MDVAKRAGRNLRLTAAGVAFAPYASDVLGLLERGGRVAAQVKLVQPTELRITTVTTAG